MSLTGLEERTVYVIQFKNSVVQISEFSDLGRSPNKTLIHMCLSLLILNFL